MAKGRESTRGRGFAIACLLACAQAALLLHTAWDKSDTADENRYVASSAALWAHGELGDLCEAPVLPKRAFGLALWLRDPAVSMAPQGWQRASEALFDGRPPEILRRIFLAARCATIALVVLAGFFVWLVALRFGRAAALVAHAIWCFSPTLLANGSLATLDPWAAALMAVVLWTGTRLVERGTAARTVVVGMACGAAAATKITTLLVVPCVAGVLVPQSWRGRRPLAALARTAALVALFLAGLAGILWLIYGGSIGGIDLADPCPFSLDGITRAAGWWPFPDWLDGVVFQLRHGREGHANYLFGEINTTGWWWFYLACLALKVTVGVQAMALLGVVARALEATRDRGAGLAVDAALLAYPLLLLVAMSAGHHQANISFLLPALPFMAVWLGRSAAAVRRTFGTAGSGVTYALLVLAVLEGLHVHPDYLMFYNVWAGGPEGGPRYLIHREDWGQDKRRLAEWQHERGIARLYYAPYGPNAERWGIVYDPVPCTPTPGVYALHAVEVHRPRFSLQPGCVDWLTVEPPDERIGHSIYVYFVDQDRIRRLASHPAESVFWRSGGGEGGAAATNAP